MIEQDTIRLLRECDAGIKMGVSSIDDVLPHVQNKDLKNILSECKRRHEALKEDLQQRLDRFGDEGKEPNPIAKGMSWMKTNMKMNLQESDATIADLMTDGCNMGVKSLSKYLNQYKAAEEYSKDIAKKLIHLEAQLARQGLSTDMYCSFMNTTKEALREDARHDAEAEVRKDAAIREIVKLEGLEASKEEIGEAVALICRQNNITVEELKPHYDAQFEQAVIHSVLTGKVMRLIRDAAIITVV